MNSDEHKRRSEKRKAGYDKKQAKASKEKGLIIVNTGPGKGKTTAALGMGMRILGHGMKLGVVQFIKGAIDCAERSFFSQLENCEFYTMGDGFTWITQNRHQDIETAEKAWQKATQLIDSDCRMVILDELNIILKYEYLPLELVLNTIAAKPPQQHIVITGRHAPQALIDMADLVSDVRVIKHPYKSGIKAQPGVEF